LFPHEGGGNQAGHHRCTAGSAERVARPAERVRPGGERESGRFGKEKGSGPWLGRKPELGPIRVMKPFGIFIWNLNFWQHWKFVQGDLEEILTWEFFLNSSRLLKEFRKI
jgi:hypothetical protein